MSMDNITGEKTRKFIFISTLVKIKIVLPVNYVNELPGEGTCLLQKPTLGPWAPEA